MSIPKDLYLVGMGNSYLGRYGTLPLTSVDFDYRLLGRCAVRSGLLSPRETTLCRTMTLLPCELLIRDSTENRRVTLPRSDHSGKTRDDYFSDERTARLLLVENVMQASGEVDRKILLLLAEGKTYARIGEAVSLTERAVSYRIDALKRRIGVARGEELRDLLKFFLS